MYLLYVTILPIPCSAAEPGILTCVGSAVVADDPLRLDAEVPGTFVTIACIVLVDGEEPIPPFPVEDILNR